MSRHTSNFRPTRILQPTKCMIHSYDHKCMLVAYHSPNKPRLWSLELSGGEPILNPLMTLFCSFDMLIAMKYGNCCVFKWSICNFWDNWNRYNKAPDDLDIGLWESFKRVCIQMYKWALWLYQTLLNYMRYCGIVCYSFIYLVDRIGQLIRKDHKDCTEVSPDMLSHVLKNAIPMMQVLEGEDKDYNGAS